MMNPQLIGEKQRLDDLFGQIDSLSLGEEHLSHWARYLCVLVSGFVENSIRVLITDYARQKSHPNVSSYVANQIRRITNLNQTKILDLLETFDPNWRRTLEERMTDDQKDALDSIVANRHNIVHGRSVGITLVRMKDYYRRVLQVVDLVESECTSKQ
jgi:hypothetical protein